MVCCRSASPLIVRHAQILPKPAVGQSPQLSLATQASNITNLHAQPILPQHAPQNVVLNSYRGQQATTATHGTVQYQPQMLQVRIDLLIWMSGTD